MCNIITRFPADMLSYINSYGLHFNKKLCEYAVKRMKKKDEAGRPVPITPLTKEQVSIMMKESGFSLSEKNVVWDAVYVANMCQADYMGGAIADNRHLAMFVKQTLDDIDACEGQTFNRWYADMCLAGEQQYIDWEEMI